MLPFQHDEMLRAALIEDAPWGDASALFIDEHATFDAKLVARVAGRLAGITLWARAFTLVDPTLSVDIALRDGHPFDAGAVLGQVSGSARSILRAERVALNLVQRMSGIATLTARYVSAVAGTGVRITDTRKTTPGLRAWERAAVRAGGGHNHRYSLSDAVMIKDNHLAAMGVTTPKAVTEALLRLRSTLPHTTAIEVEVDRLDQLKAVLAADVDVIMLDNFSNDDLRTGVAMIGGRSLVEASGGITLARVRSVAETGVDLISVGALTQAAAALDLGLDVDEPGAAHAG